MLDNLRRLVGMEKETSTGTENRERPAKVPHHVAIIMDGNGRWAVRRGLPRTAGHRSGVEALRKVVEACPLLGVQVLTVYAFSTENWKRSRDEVDFLMRLLVEYCRNEVAKLNESGVRINAIGRIDQLPDLQRTELRRAMELTKNNTRLLLNLAVNYGGQAELVDSVRRLAAQVQAGELRPEEIDEAMIGQHLYTAGQPDPDLVIRTAGEMRLSNFLLWQTSYSEFWVTDLMWPDFGREQLEQAIHDYSHRERRFGAVLQRSR